MQRGTFSTLSYLLATSLLQLGCVVLMALCAIGPAYAIGDGPWSAFGNVVFALWSGMFAFEAAGQLLGVMALSYPVLGMLAYLGLWASAFLFSGFFVAARAVAWPLRGACVGDACAPSSRRHARTPQVA